MRRGVWGGVAGGGFPLHGREGAARGKASGGGLKEDCRRKETECEGRARGGGGGGGGVYENRKRSE